MVGEDPIIQRARPIQLNNPKEKEEAKLKTRSVRYRTVRRSQRFAVEMRLVPRLLTRSVESRQSRCCMPLVEGALSLIFTSCCLLLSLLLLLAGKSWGLMLGNYGKRPGLRQKS